MACILIIFWLVLQEPRRIQKRTQDKRPFVIFPGEFSMLDRSVPKELTTHNDGRLTLLGIAFSF